MAGFGRYQVHFILMSNNTIVGKGPHRDLPRRGDHIKMDEYVAEDPSYVNVEYEIVKVLWHVKDPTTLVQMYVQPA